MDEALLPETEITSERRDDWQEVRNYTKAMNSAIANLEHLKFIPPSHQLVPELMSDFEKFLNNDQIKMPALMKIAVAHYQFETIHPFLDGNGRIGRLLITLFLVKEGILNKPLLYLSNFFESPKDRYYDNLSGVRLKNDMLQWIKYFLVGVEQTASLASTSLLEILTLKENIEHKIRTTYGRRANNGILLLHALFEQPFVTIEQVLEICKVTYKSAGELVKQLCGQDIGRSYQAEQEPSFCFWLVSCHLRQKIAQKERGGKQCLPPLSFWVILTIILSLCTANIQAFGVYKIPFLSLRKLFWFVPRTSTPILFPGMPFH